MDKEQQQKRDQDLRQAEPVHDLKGIPREFKEKNTHQSLEGYETRALHSDKDEFYQDELQKRRMEEEGNISKK